jgi:hypothetical protein
MLSKSQLYRIEGEGGGEVSGARVNSPLIVRCRLEALLAGLPQQRVQLLPLSYHLRSHVKSFKTGTKIGAAANSNLPHFPNLRIFLLTPCFSID